MSLLDVGSTINKYLELINERIFKQYITIYGDTIKAGNAMHNYCSSCGTAGTSASFDDGKFPIEPTANTAPTEAVFRVVETSSGSDINVGINSNIFNAGVVAGNSLHFGEDTKLEIDGTDLVYLKCIDTTGNNKITYYDLFVFSSRTDPTVNSIYKDTYMDYLARFKILAYIRDQNYKQNELNDYNTIITADKLNIKHYIDAINDQTNPQIYDILEIIREINSKYHDKYELLINCLYHYYQLIIYEYNYHYIDKQLDYYKNFSTTNPALTGKNANSVHDILEKILKDLLVTQYDTNNKSKIDKALESGTLTHTFISDLANLCGTVSATNKNMNVVFFDSTNDMYNSIIDSSESDMNTYIINILASFDATNNTLIDSNLSNSTVSDENLATLLSKVNSDITGDSDLTDPTKISTALNLMGITIPANFNGNNIKTEIENAIVNIDNQVNNSDIASALVADEREKTTNRLKFMLKTEFFTAGTADTADIITYKYAAVAINAFLYKNNGTVVNDTVGEMKTAIKKKIIDFGSTFDEQNNIIIDKSSYDIINIGHNLLSSNDENIFFIDTSGISTLIKLSDSIKSNIKSIKCNSVLAKLTSATDSDVENALATLTFSDNFKTDFALSTKYPGSINPTTASPNIPTAFTGVLAKLQTVKNKYDSAKQIYEAREKLLENYKYIEEAIDSQINNDSKNESSIETKIKTIQKYDDSYKKSVDKYKTNHTELNKVVKSNLYNNIFLYITIFVIILACLGLIYINNNKANLRTQYSIAVIVCLLLYYIIYTNLVISVTEEFFETSTPLTTINNTELTKLHNKIYNRLLILSGAEYNYNKSLDKEQVKYKEYAKSTDTKVQSLKMILNDEFINAIKSKELIKFLLLFTFISIVTYIAHININDLTTTCILFIILFIIVLCIYFYNINLVSRSIYNNKYWNHQMIKK